MKMILKVTLSVFILSLTWGCGDGGKSPRGDGSLTSEHGSQSKVSSKSEQRQGSCPSSPTELVGTGEAGTSCSSFSDCAAVCCPCSATSRKWLAAACVDGICASAAATCARTESSFLCGGTVYPDGGSTPPPPPPPPHADAGPPGAAVCVDGDYSSCYGTGEHWTGKLCCVDGPVECVDGTYSSCYGTGEHWTGKLCCVEGPATCVDGDYSSCYGSEEHWTGSLCCVQGIVSCVAGTYSSCYGTGKHWTGKLCCVK